MALSNCMFSFASENPPGFSVWFVHAKDRANHATTHSPPR